MKIDDKPSIYNNKDSGIELERYGVWVKNEPEDLIDDEIEEFDKEKDGKSVPEDAFDFDGFLDEDKNPPQKDKSLDNLPQERGDESEDAESFADNQEGGDTEEFPDFDLDDLLNEEIDINQTDAAQESPQEKAPPENTLSNDLLATIANELSALKSEISTLKTELSTIKAAKQPEPAQNGAETTARETGASAENTTGGFFDDDDDKDESIALTEAELDKIIKSDVIQSGEISDEHPVNENEAPVNEDPENEDWTPEPEAGAALEDEFGSDMMIDPAIEELSGMNYNAPPVENGAEAGAEDAGISEDAAINEAPPDVAAAAESPAGEAAADEVVANEVPADDFDFPEFDINELLNVEPTAPDAETASTEGGVSAAEGAIDSEEDDSGEIAGPPVAEEAPPVAEEAHVEIAEPEEFAAPVEDADAETAEPVEEPVEFDLGDIELGESLENAGPEQPEPEAAAFEEEAPVEIAEPEAAAAPVEEAAPALEETPPVLEEGAVEITLPGEEAVTVEETPPVEEAPPMLEEAAPAEIPAQETPASPVASAPVSAGGESVIDEALKNEIKDLLLYMDQLLESLPDEKVNEFAASEKFDTYKKVFKELDLV